MQVYSSYKTITVESKLHDLFHFRQELPWNHYPVAKRFRLMVLWCFTGTMSLKMRKYNAF